MSHNTLATHAATWWEKLAADLYYLDDQGAQELVGENLKVVWAEL
jgi:hypothetical protein